MGYQYRSRDDLRGLGLQVRDKAVAVTMSQGDSYAEAQRYAHNDATRYRTYQTPLTNRNYQPPTSGAPDDGGNIRRYAEQMYADVPALFTAFSVPDPDLANGMVETLYRAAVTMQPSLAVAQQGGKLANPLLTSALSGTVPVKQMTAFIGVHMKNWDGPAAEAFSSYVNGFETSVQLQRELAIALAITLEMHLEVRRRMLTDVWEIGQQALKVLEVLDAAKFPSRTTLQVALTVAGAIAAVLVELASEGGATPILAEVLQGAGGILGLGGDNIPKGPIGGATVPPVISSMSDLMTRLRKTTDAQEQEIVACLSKLGGAVRDNWRRILPDAPHAFTSLGTAGVDVLDGSKQFYDR